MNSQILIRPDYRKDEEKNEWVIYHRWELHYDRYEYTPENVEIVSNAIRDKLTPKMLSTKYREENRTNPLFGHCYHSTQALYYFLDTDNLAPHSGRDHRGIIHWWLKDKNEIIDITEDSYDANNLPPYDVGKKSKWFGWKERVHKRTLDLMNSVQPTSQLMSVNLS